MATGEEMSLEVIPTAEDYGVQTVVNKLQDQLLMKQYNLSIKKVGKYLYIATLAMAQKSEQLIKVQNALLDILKLNDTSAIMLQSFQSGAKNIVEKLKVAYLYLLDGFPEFAKTDIDAISKDINTMKNQADKTKASTAKNAKNDDEIKKELKNKEEEAKDFMNKARATNTRIDKRMNRQPSYQGDGTNDHSSNDGGHQPGCCDIFWELFPCCWCSCCESCCCECCKKTRRSNSREISEQPRSVAQEEVKVSVEDMQRYQEDMELFQLAFTSLEKSVQILKECDGFLDQLLKVVNDWYKENKEVVTPEMSNNIAKAESMSEAEKMEHWESVMFRQEVQTFYRRWVALKLYCEKTRANLKTIRAETEGWYVDNPRPRDAVKKAWDIAKSAEDRDIDNLVEKRENRIARGDLAA